MRTNPIPIACTLTTKDAASQLDEWAQLRASATAVTPIDGGYLVHLPSSAEAATRDLAAREASCCSFLTLSVERVEGGVELAITGPEDAAPVIGLIVDP